MEIFLPLYSALMNVEAEKWWSSLGQGLFVGAGTGAKVNPRPAQ